MKASRLEALELLLDPASTKKSPGGLSPRQVWRETSFEHAQTLEDAHQIWSAIGAAALDCVTEEDHALFGLGLADEPSGAFSRRRVIGVGAVAASVAATALLTTQGFSPLSYLWKGDTTKVGEQRVIAAAADVSIELNTKTSIDRYGFRETRSIELVAGEAAIVTSNPASGKAMTVVANAGRVRAKDAAFTVRLLDTDSVRVICIAGEVDVVCFDKQVTLHTEQQLSYSSRGIGDATPANLETSTSWRRGVLVFREEPLAAVLDEINRYLPQPIILRNDRFSSRLVNVLLDIKTLDGIADYCERAFGLRAVRTADGQIFLS